ncbi:MAG: hypothetical protein IKW06_02220 [Clostridia bacterium]|nr:hypothetical protein [Clostridia bacterium]
MYEIIKKVINEGRFNLSDLLVKIDTLWVQGSLAKEQKDELVVLAQEKADFKSSFDIFLKLQELDERVKALETVEESEEQPEETTAPAEYVPGKWYYNGDKVTFEGKEFVCIAPLGQVCTWSPAEYPAYWA